MLSDDRRKEVNCYVRALWSLGLREAPANFAVLQPSARPSWQKQFVHAQRSQNSGLIGQLQCTASFLPLAFALLLREVFQALYMK